MRPLPLLPFLPPPLWQNLFAFLAFPIPPSPPPCPLPLVFLLLSSDHIDSFQFRNILLFPGRGDGRSPPFSPLLIFFSPFLLLLKPTLSSSVLLLHRVSEDCPESLESVFLLPSPLHDLPFHARFELPNRSSSFSSSRPSPCSLLPTEPHGIRLLTPIGFRWSLWMPSERIPSRARS